MRTSDFYTARRLTLVDGTTVEVHVSKLTPGELFAVIGGDAFRMTVSDAERFAEFLAAAAAEAWALQKK